MKKKKLDQGNWMPKQINKQKQKNEQHGKLLVAICTEEILKMPTKIFKN